MGTLTLFTELAGSLRLILSLVQDKEHKKYWEELEELEDERTEELRKPSYEGPSGEIPKEQRQEYLDHAVLDDLDRRLCQLSRKIGATLRGANSVSKPH